MFSLQIVVFSAACIFLDAIAGRVILVAVGRDAVDLHLADAVVRIPCHAEAACAADAGHAAVVVIDVAFVDCAGVTAGTSVDEAVGGVDVVVQRLAAAFGVGFAVTY